MSYRERGAGVLVTVATSDMASIGSALTEANAVAAARTTGVVAAAEDEVSAAIAALFSGHGQLYQALSARVAAFHTQFVQALTGPGPRTRPRRRRMPRRCRPCGKTCRTWR